MLRGNSAYKGRTVEKSGVPGKSVLQDHQDLIINFQTAQDDTVGKNIELDNT